MSGSIFDAAGCHGRPGTAPTSSIDPHDYIAVHGPRAGDRIRLRHLAPGTTVAEGAR